MSGHLAIYNAMSVLVVDDNPSNCALMAALLNEQGMYRVHTETDARRVPRRLVEDNPDLVLLDLHMPHVDGHTVLTQIQRFAAGTFLPVLVLTADTTIETRDLALSQGAQDYLTKPVDFVEATLRIANLLQTRRLLSALRQTAEPPQERGRRWTDRVQRRDRTQTVLNERSISPVFQPVVDLNSLQIVGHEGLSRFPGDSPWPAPWFADAFEVGLGVELEWLAAQTLLGHLDELPPDTFLAINMSPVTILHAIERDLCPPDACSRVVIELIEHVPIEDYSVLQRALAALREFGAKLAADDLGSGYAGFRHLVDLRPDIIKLDMSLVRGIHRSSGQRALASALVAFAADVGARVIAEGVEEQDELDMLRTIGVTWAQGYHLGRPLPLSTAALTLAG
ncbi:MAG TPA: EAL domain-containing response regulator [Frankiaceae bacterium]|jgi:EAL domain-containing protein (putative c-di-GMP-specific phosphodiesterase class I)|nr:EAL domain-containing response regulator [Frankiaceae bacterium]